MRYLSSCTTTDLKNKRVLVRVDCNVPIHKGKIIDISRLRASLPTIKFLQKKGAKVILLGHLGRPKGRVSQAYAMAAVAKAYSTLLKKSVRILDTKSWKWSNDTTEAMVQATKRIRSGSVIMCDNLRFTSREQEQDPGFIAQLASLGDVFVLDGFGVSHREDASVVGLPKLLPSYAGLLLEKEIAGLTPVLSQKRGNTVLFIGGAKPQTKIPVIKNLYRKVDHIFIGGTIANTYLVAKGYYVGKSLFEPTMKKEVLRWCKKRKAHMPIDVVVGNLKGTSYRVVDVGRQKKLCGHDEYILDIGPKTIQRYSQFVNQAQCLIWNGGMGYFEQAPYHIGTMAVARLLGKRAKGRAYGLAGGGETLLAIKRAKVGTYIDHVSTGGGAMLTYLATGTTPGIEALKLSPQDVV